MKYGALLRIQRGTAATVLRRVLLQWSLSTLLFFLRLAASALKYSSVYHAFQGSVNRFERWSRPRRYGSILDDPRLSPKIRNVCTLASGSGHRMLWMDSACINQDNTPELSKVLDSHYAWFHNATLCYVYLKDVPKLDDPRAPESAFRRSPWFTGCWTLSDLVAPREIVFLSQEWEVIGTKEDLADLIEDITGIDRDILTHNKAVHEVSVAERISWAMNRSSRRAEDHAYCLLGLFDITMTYQYGEGGERALRRLLTKVLRRNPKDHGLDAQESNDRTPSLVHSILAEQRSTSPGTLRPSHSSRTLLAQSPSAFALSGNIRSIPRIPDFCDRLETLISTRLSLHHTEYTPFPCGIHAKLRLITLPRSTGLEGVGTDTTQFQWYLALLSCERTSGTQGPSLLARLCYSPSHSSPLGPEPLTLHVGEFIRLGDSSPPGMLRSWHEESLISLLKDDFEPLGPLSIQPEVASVCIPHPQHPPRFHTKLDMFDSIPRDSVTKVMIPRWTKAALHEHGYQIDNSGGSSLSQTSTVALHCTSMPLIMYLKKHGEEAAILLPVRPHPLARYQRGWIVDDEEGTTRTLRCSVVPSTNPIFKTITSATTSHTLSYDLLEEVKRHCASQNEWRVGEETARPTLHYLAPNHYDLRIDIVQE